MTPRALGVLAVLVVLLLAGCTDPSPEFPEGMEPDPLAPTDPTEPCSDEPPDAEPGEAPLLFTLSKAGLVWVVYADGTALTHREANDGDLDAGGVLSNAIISPYDGGPGVWNNAYVAECDLTPLVEAAEEYFAAGPDVGSYPAEDMAETVFSFYGAGSEQVVAAYDYDTDERTAEQRADFQMMRDLIAALASAMRSDGTTAAVTTVQVRVAPGAESPDWDAPPLSDVLVDGCAVYTGDDATAVVRYLTEDERGQPLGLHARTVPPGVPTCEY